VHGAALRSGAVRPAEEEKLRPEAIFSAGTKREQKAAKNDLYGRNTKDSVGEDLWK
jgi:hypothetical protein